MICLFCSPNFRRAESFLSVFQRKANAIVNTNPLPIIPLETCSSVLWRGAPGLIGYESLTENETLTGLHIEDMYTLELVYQGLQEIHLDGIWRSVPPSHIVWTSPQAVHAHRLFVGLESLFVAFPKDLVEQVYRELSNNSPPQVPHAMILPCPPQLQDMLSHLLHEMQGHQSPPDYMAQCYGTCHQPQCK